MVSRYGYAMDPIVTQTEALAQLDSDIQRLLDEVIRWNTDVLPERAERNYAADVTRPWYIIVPFAFVMFSSLCVMFFIPLIWPWLPHFIDWVEEIVNKVHYKVEGYYTVEEKVELTQKDPWKFYPHWMSKDNYVRLLKVRKEIAKLPATKEIVLRDFTSAR